jgi:hypothetical protein
MEKVGGTKIVRKMTKTGEERKRRGEGKDKEGLLRGHWGGWTPLCVSV